MSHITHLYHLSALDFINTSTFPGMAPWLPSYTASDMIDGNSTLGSTLVVNYVTALEKRRKMHTAGALFSGRQPIQNAMVPGGATTLFSSTYPDNPITGDYDQFGPFNATSTVSKFKSLLNDVRTFINTKYIPNVVTVANAFPGYWSQGVGCTNLLAYGDYPINSTGTLAIKRGRATVITPSTFDQAQIREYVGGSYYNYGILDAEGLHPFDGKTTPNMGTANGYSWIKAPRYMDGTTPKVYEVGPLARMVNTYLRGTQVTADDTVVGGTSLGQALGTSSLGAYSVTALVDTALGLSARAQQLFTARSEDTLQGLWKPST